MRLEVVGIQIPSVQDLLAGPKPQRIILCLSVSEDLRTQNVGDQHNAADQEKNIERCSQRGVSQHNSLSRSATGNGRIDLWSPQRRHRPSERTATPAMRQRAIQELLAETTKAIQRCSTCSPKRATYNACYRPIEPANNK